MTGVKIGDALEYNKCLRKVNLSSNSFKQETADAINKAMIKNKRIVKLKLGRNLIK